MSSNINLWDVPAEYSVLHLARELSQCINAGTITNIEGAFLSNLHLHDVQFDTVSGVISSSLTQTQFKLSLYRLREP